MNNKKLSKKHAVVLIVSILLIAVFVTCVKWMFSPHKGKIINTSGSTSVPATYTDKTLDGTYIVFSYSGRYLAKNETPKNEDLELHMLKADTHYDKQIIATVSNLPDGQLNSYGNYIFRKTRSDLYASRQLAVSGTSVNIWVKKDGTEQTVMIPHGDKVATIVFSTTSNSDDLTPEANALLSTFKWKK